MSVQFYIEDATPWEGGVLVNGYVEGVIPVGFTFKRARRYLEMQEGKCIKLQPPLAEKPVGLVVMKAIAYDQELPALTGMSGSLLLQGEGMSEIGWGEVLSD